MVAMNSESNWVLTAAFVLVAGCGPATDVEMPLVDSKHGPIVVAEQRKLSLPSAAPGTRFVRGWRFERGGDGLAITAPDSTATVEVVQLAGRQRRLILDVAEGTGDARATVSARTPSRHLGNFTIHDGVDIPLPADIGLGRIPIELQFSAPVELSGASMSEALPRGRVEFEGRDVIQSGWSAVDFVRWVGGGTRLVGELERPTGMRRGQEFSVIVGGDGWARTALEMGRSKSERAEQRELFDLELIDAPGLVRIRLTAEGRGPAGWWRDLRLVSRQHPSTLPDAIPDPPKLVVLYVLDALRADHMGHLGSMLGASPCIDRLAFEGAVFTNHFSVAPNTRPSTKSLFTGYGFLEGRPLAADGPATLAEIFGDAGFVTASISSNFNVSPGLGLTRGFDHYELLPLEHTQDDGVETTVNDSAERIHGAALRWLAESPGDAPVFLYLHTLHPHNPYNPPQPLPSRLVTGPPVRVDGGTSTSMLVAIRNRELEVGPQDEERIRRWYAANLAYNDAEICSLAEELESRYPGEVLLVVTSDHGEELFDHDGVLHGYTLYDEMLHVPLVVWSPGRVAPARIDEPTDTLDLHVTLRDLVSPTKQRQHEDGESLWRLMAGISGADAEPRLHFATAPGLRWAAMARSGRWKLILAQKPRLRWGMGRGRGRTHDAEYFFDLEDDPGEHSNLAGMSSVATDWLWSRLQAWRAAWQRRQSGWTDRAEIDETTRQQLEAIGYLD
jgi:arylsulfatase A-like enzyme